MPLRTTSPQTSNTPFSAKTSRDSLLISDYDTFVNDSLINEASKLPDWDLANKETVSAYMNFFRTYGTHTIVAAYSGWKYQPVKYNNRGDREL